MTMKGGRKPIYTYYKGEMVQVKPLVKIGNSYGIVLPTDWVQVQGGAENIRHILLDVRDTTIIIKPCFEELESGVLT
jgi:antitoxin component of MazEF toxin-antitoxin module